MAGRPGLRDVRRDEAVGLIWAGESGSTEDGGCDCGSVGSFGATMVWKWESPSMMHKPGDWTKARSMNGRKRKLRVQVM